MPTMVERTTKEGDDYTQARRAFNILLAEYGSGMSYVARYVGGVSTSRSHKGDKDGRAPIEAIDPKVQREALTLLETEVFNDKPFQFPPELYNHLAASNWSHWGTGFGVRKWAISSWLMFPSTTPRTFRMPLTRWRSRSSFVASTNR